jgi:hypothetical protein
VDRVNEIGAQLASQKRSPRASVERGQQRRFGGSECPLLRAVHPVGRCVAAGFDPVRQAADAVAAWDMHLKDANHDGRYDGPGVTILQAWLKAMTTAVFKDELPAGVLASLTDLGYAPLTGRAGQPAAGAGIQAVVQRASRGLFGRPATPRLSERPGTGHRRSRRAGQRRGGFDPPARRRHVSMADAGAQTPVFQDQRHWRAMGHAGPGGGAVSKPGNGGIPGGLAQERGGDVFADGARPEWLRQSGAEKTRHYDDQLRLFEAGACKPDVVGAQSVDARLESSQTLTIKR